MNCKGKEMAKGGMVNKYNKGGMVKKYNKGGIVKNKRSGGSGCKVRNA